MKTINVKMTPEVFDNLVINVSNQLNTVSESDFKTRTEFLGYVVELSEILETLQNA